MHHLLQSQQRVCVHRSHLGLHVWMLKFCFMLPAKTLSGWVGITVAVMSKDFTKATSDNSASCLQTVLLALADFGPLSCWKINVLRNRSSFADENKSSFRISLHCRVSTISAAKVDVQRLRPFFCFHPLTCDLSNIFSDNLGVYFCLNIVVVAWKY